MTATRSRVGAVFDRVAHRYDMKWLQSLVYRPVQDRVLAELRAAGSRRILDVGCGTGIFAARLSRELGGAVVCGCDFSAGMLGVAAGRPEAVGWVRGDAHALAVQGGAFDAVVCTQAFHFFDQPLALSEFRRVSAPGGYVLIGMINTPTEPASRRLSRLASRVADVVASWPTPAGMEALLAGAGFEVVAQHPVDWPLRRWFPVIVSVGRARPGREADQ